MRCILILFSIVMVSACSAPKDSVGKENTAAEAKAAFENYVRAIDSGDVEKAAAMYDDGSGFHWIERGGVQYDKGTDAASSLRAISQSGGKPQMTIDNVRVAEMGDGGALVSAHFDYAMLGADGEPQFAFDGWMTVGMVRREDGWKIAGGQIGPGTAAGNGSGEQR